MQTRTMFFILMAFVTTLVGAVARAQLPTGEIREFYNSPRSLAMGGASIAVVNDESALLHNPAGLGKLRDFFGTLIDPDIAGTSQAGTLYKNQGFTQPFYPEDVYNTVNATRETYYHAQAQLFPSIVVKNFGIGVFGRYLLDAEVNSTGTQYYYHYWDDLAVLLGYNLRIWDGRIKIGVTGKAISRIEVDKTLDPAVDNLTVDANASEGLGLGGDVGIILAAPWTWIPTLAVVVRDVGGTNFEGGSGLRKTTTSRPAKIDQDYDVAIALFPIHGNYSRSSFTIEAQKITQAQLATDKTRYLHVGYEFNYADVVFLRLGYNQHYATGGIEIASERTQIQITSYGEDVGPDSAPVEDRRLVFKFSLRF